jgi:hypothetical protein
MKHEKKKKAALSSLVCYGYNVRIACVHICVCVGSYLRVSIAYLRITTHPLTRYITSLSARAPPGHEVIANFDFFLFTYI